MNLYINDKVEYMPRSFYDPFQLVTPNLNDSFKYKFQYKKVIFHPPATIVYWEDGTKTVVKCQKDEDYDPEKGLALCFMKRALGNKGNYNNIIRKEIKEEDFFEREMYTTPQKEKEKDINED